jgi:hypothetical protein
MTLNQRYGWSKDAIKRYHSYRRGGRRSPQHATDPRDRSLPVSQCGIWLHHTTKDELEVPIGLTRCHSGCTFPVGEPELGPTPKEAS